MSDKEKQVLQSLAEQIPKMSEFSKGYILGMCEAMEEKASEISREAEGEGDGYGSAE